MKTTAPLALLLLASCSTGPAVERHASLGPMGRLIVRPVGKDGVEPDYVVRLRRDHVQVAEGRTALLGPVLFHDLKPGEYTVRIEGPRLGARARVEVEAGTTTTIDWPLDRSLRLSKRGQKVVEFLVTLPFRLAGALIKDLLFGDDDDDDDDCSHGRRKDEPEKRRPESGVKW